MLSFRSASDTVGLSDTASANLVSFGVSISDLLGLRDSLELLGVLLGTVALNDALANDVTLVLELVADALEETAVYGEVALSAEPDEDVVLEIERTDETTLRIWPEVP
jgi:hypothetical protein